MFWIFVKIASLSGDSNKYPKRMFYEDIRKNKKSAESDVAPAGIKSYKFLFVLKKIYFAVFKIDKLEKWTK